MEGLINLRTLLEVFTLTLVVFLFFHSHCWTVWGGIFTHTISLEEGVFLLTLLDWNSLELYHPSES